jgi:hypothetical protein
VRGLLWILGGVVLLDAALVAVVAICAAVVRRRGPGAVRDPVTWWPLDPRSDTEREDHAPVVPIRLHGGVAAAVAPASREPRRPGRRTVAIALVAAMVFAGTAFASPQIRRFVATAFGSVTGLTTHTEGIEQEGAARPPTSGDASGRPGAAGTAGASRSASPSRSGDPVRGPAVEPRPPGVPHGGVLAPAAPSNLTARAASSSQVDLAWTDVEGETGIRVERAPDPSGGWSGVADLGQGATSWTDAGLAPGTTYFYRVVATNAGGDSPASNVASATTSIDPASPTTVTAVASSPTQIDLEWTDVANETGYRVERADGSGGWTTVATTGQDVTASSDTGLEPGTTYSYRVFATNAAGDSAASDVATATTPPAGEDSSASPAPDASDPGEIGARMPSHWQRVG